MGPAQPQCTKAQAMPAAEGIFLGIFSGPADAIRKLQLTNGESTRVLITHYLRKIEASAELQLAARHRAQREDTENAENGSPRAAGAKAAAAPNKPGSPAALPRGLSTATPAVRQGYNSSGGDYNSTSRSCLRRSQAWLLQLPLVQAARARPAPPPAPVAPRSSRSTTCTASFLVTTLATSMTPVTTTTRTTSTERHSSSTLRFYGEFAGCPCSHRPGLGAWPLPRLIPRCSGFACSVLRFCFKSARRASGDHVKPQFRMLATCCEPHKRGSRRLM